MTQSSLIRLGIEELAVIISLMGRPEIAKATLVGSLGSISADEEKGRLLAAHHSLISKDVLFLHGAQPRLNEQFVHLVSPLIQSDFVLRYSRGGNGQPEQVMAHYFRSKTIVKHEIQQSVVHQFSEVTSPKDIVVAGQQFFDLANVTLFDSEVVEISHDQMEEAKKLALVSSEVVRNYLSQLGIPIVVGELLAEDLHNTTFRGSVMRVEAEPEGRLRSDRGFLLLRGETGRFWIFRILTKKTGPTIQINPGSLRLFQEDTISLMKS